MRGEIESAKLELNKFLGKGFEATSVQMKDHIDCGLGGR